jgi:predicted lactoylglutathione lyase
MAVAPRISLITLAVADVAVATRFYQALGWPLSSASQPEASFFDLGGIVLSLYGRGDLARDLGQEAASGASGPGAAMTLAQNQPSRAEVDRVLAEAAAAGGAVLKPPHETHWGGYVGYVADPDGHVWEIAHNPFWPLDAEGRIVLPPPGPGGG